MPGVNPVLASLHNGLIVSCQAEGDDPFNRPEYVALFAQAAERGGARGIRACDTANIHAIREKVSLPIIGITKSRFEDGSVLITPDFPDVEQLRAAGTSIVAVDGTGRVRPNSLKGHEFIRELKQRGPVPLMADVATLEEGEACAEAGADVVATTLAGYTPYTRGLPDDEPDWALLCSLVKGLRIPIIVEGRVWTPRQARQAIDLGAFAVVVGTAITRPTVLVGRFAAALLSTESHG